MGESSIPCTEPTRDRLKALRGDGYKNWDTFLNELADAWEARFDGSGVDDKAPAGGVDADLREQLDRIESAAKEATNAAQSAEHAIENMGGR